MPRFPSRIPSAVVSGVARTLAAKNKEAARALPDSKGGETPKSLQSYRTSVYTYFTRNTGETLLLYSAENWVRIKLTLETAGPVAIGTNANLGNVLSGQGRLLDTDEEFETYLPKGNRLYAVSESVNRVAVTIEPVQWMEQLSNQQEMQTASIQSAINQLGRTLLEGLAQLRGLRPAPTAPSGLQVDQLPPAPAGSVQRARLTPVIGGKKMRP
jgi:hypothetical protein